MRIINLTPHPITLQVVGNGVNHGEVRDITILSSGAARLESRDRELNQFAADEPAEWPDGGHFNVVERTFGDITGPPEPAELTIYVVSMPVAQRAAEIGRTDVYAPDTGPSAIRDAKGQIMAVRGLVRFRPASRYLSEDLYQRILSLLRYNPDEEKDPAAEYEEGVEIPTLLLVQLRAELERLK